MGLPLSKYPRKNRRMGFRVTFLGLFRNQNWIFWRNWPEMGRRGWVWAENWWKMIVRTFRIFLGLSKSSEIQKIKSKSSEIPKIWSLLKYTVGNLVKIWPEMGRRGSVWAENGWKWIPRGPGSFLNRFFILKIQIFILKTPDKPPLAANMLIEIPKHAELY